ncbi:MAG: hypothetical protein OIF50_14065 [Flavobacteriaceae bacterium]|nr:hypothetical protein [Flavobacteriaceae bacterium]
MKRFLPSLLLLILCSQTSFGQNPHQIHFPTTKESQLCDYFNSAFQARSKEIQFSIKRENQSLYLYVNHKAWFSRLFQNAKDGIAIDVVNKGIYDCAKPKNTSYLKGKVLKPIYKKSIERGLKSVGDNQFRILVGRIPPQLAKKELEYNILFLNNNNLCLYHRTYNLNSYPWELLDMGMYLDSVVYNNKSISSKKKYKYRFKTLSFTIPFEKNKSNYKPEDIKPMYDSLRLTDFNIKRIRIQAYASVEGSKARNMELQQKRAQSITQALQSFQKDHIETKIRTAENWVEFFNDIEGTKWTSLKPLSKEQIKSKLIGTIAKNMEPILQKHRKAVIELELDKKDLYREMTATALVDQFSQAIQNQDLETAKAIHSTLFQRIKLQKTKPETLNQLQIPKQNKFLPLLIDNAAYRYLVDYRNLLIAHNELQQLLTMAPKDMRIRYNLVALKLQMIWYNAGEVDRKILWNEIQNIQALGIHKPLIDRMRINYHILESRKHMNAQNFDKKDQSISFILQTYKKVNKSDMDYLSLAQFLSFYANTDEATALLEKKVLSLTINEDLLFYFINLTIINDERIEDEDYRNIMLNAYNKNPERFCEIFQSIENKGITFQLLENEYLKQYYCENCN